MNVSVFGLGYVGCVTAACLARDGHHVVGVDLNSDKVAMVNAGQSPIIEPGLGDVLARVVRLTVGLRSTVRPGTTERVLARVLSECTGGRMAELRIAVNPEFMREGTSLEDFDHPPFVLVGCDDPDTATQMRQLYGGVTAPFLQTSVRTAEMVKYVCNAFHALKIAFTNEIADLCDALGADAQDVMRVFRQDRKLNIAPAYLKPGFAYGGSCLPKDIRALLCSGRIYDVS